MKSAVNSQPNQKDQLCLMKSNRFIRSRNSKEMHLTLLHIEQDGYILVVVYVLYKLLELYSIKYSQAWNY